MITTSKKLHAIIFVTLCLLATSNNLRAAQHYNETPAGSYYKENPWDFVENWFMDEAYEPVFIECIGITAAALCVYLSTFAVLDGLGTTPDTTVIASLTTSIATIITTIGLSKKFNETLVLSHTKKQLKPFFENYSTNLQKPSNKQLLPTSLHTSFDSLYNGYKKHGDNYLETHGPFLLGSIRDTIRYKIKPKKYVKPKTIVVPSYYAHSWYRN